MALALGGRIAIFDGSAAEAPCVRLGRKPMTRAIMGYATPTELSLIHDGCDLPGPCREVADALLPARKPHLIHENIAFAAPGDFGIVP